MELEDLFHRFPQRNIIMLHYTLESDRGKISESSSGLYKTDLSFSKSFFEGLLPGLRHSIFLWFHSIMVEQEGLPSCEHPPENCEFPLKKKIVYRNGEAVAVFIGMPIWE